MSFNVDGQFLRNLEKNKTSESVNIEYKYYDEKEKIITDKEKSDITKEIVALSNANGGIIVIGMTNSCELKGMDWDDEFINSYIESMFQKISTNIEPNVNVSINPIKISDTHKVIVINIPISYNTPHSQYNGSKYNYYIRIGNITFTMSPDQLKQSFLRSLSIEQKIIDFRNERIRLIRQGINNVYSTVPILLLHIVPYNSFENNNQFDISDYEKMRKILPFGNSFDYGPNIDGFIIYHPDVNLCFSLINDYVQIFRNGTIELFDSYYMSYKDYIDVPHILNWVEFEKLLFEKIKEYSDFMKDIPKPWAIMISMINVAKQKSYDKNRRIDYIPLDRNEVYSPIVVYQEGDELFDSVKPMFDALANCFGLSKSKLKKDDNCP